MRTINNMELWWIEEYRGNKLNVYNSLHGIYIYFYSVWATARYCRLANRYIPAARVSLLSICIHSFFFFLSLISGYLFFRFSYGGGGKFCQFWPLNWFLLWQPFAAAASVQIASLFCCCCFLFLGAWYANIVGVKQYHLTGLYQELYTRQICYHISMEIGFLIG